MIEYVRIKFQPAGVRPRWYWAIKIKPLTYKRVKKDGSETMKETKSAITEELLIGEPLIEKPAKMNLHYAWLEVV